MVLERNGGPGVHIDPPEDCAPCRVTGVVLLSGFALYWNHLRLITPKTARTHRIFYGTTSLGNIIVSVNSEN
jgi:hypothetical protein